MTIRLNGEPYELAGPMTISALLAAAEIDPRRVAVEHNLVIVKRDAYEHEPFRTETRSRSSTSSGEARTELGTFDLSVAVPFPNGVIRMTMRL